MRASVPRNFCQTHFGPLASATPSDFRAGLNGLPHPSTLYASYPAHLGRCFRLAPQLTFHLSTQRKPDLQRHSPPKYQQIWPQYIPLNRMTNHICLVPERFHCYRHPRINNTTSHRVITHHQFMFDKPTFPACPAQRVQLISQYRQIMRAPSPASQARRAATSSPATRLAPLGGTDCLATT